MFDRIKNFGNKILEQWKEKIIDEAKEQIVELFTEENCKKLVNACIDGLDKLADKSATGIDDYIIGEMREAVNENWEWVWDTLFGTKKDENGELLFCSVGEEDFAQNFAEWVEGFKKDKK